VRTQIEFSQDPKVLWQEMGKIRKLVIERAVWVAPLIAIVDDEQPVRRAVERLLKCAGLEVESFSSAEEFLQTYSARTPNCLILDLRLPAMSGRELQSRLTASARTLPIIVVSAYDDEESRAAVLRAGAVAFLGKPFHSEILLQAIQRALQSK
jgi:two-component system, LuxR family, response regulator FixJ